MLDRLSVSLCTITTVLTVHCTIITRLPTVARLDQQPSTCTKHPIKKCNCVNIQMTKPKGT